MLRGAGIPSGQRQSCSKKKKAKRRRKARSYFIARSPFFASDTHGVANRLKLTPRSHSVTQSLSLLSAFFFVPWGCRWVVCLQSENNSCLPHLGKKILTRIKPKCEENFGGKNRERNQAWFYFPRASALRDLSWIPNGATLISERMPSFFFGVLIMSGVNGM